MLLPGCVELYLRHACVQRLQGAPLHISRPLPVPSPLYLGQRPVSASHLGLLEVQAVSPTQRDCWGLRGVPSLPCVLQLPPNSNWVIEWLTLFLFSQVSYSCLTFWFVSENNDLFYQFSSSLQQRGLSELCCSFIASYRKH